MAKLAPYLNLPDAQAALEFYKSAFGAEVTQRFDAPDGRIVHSEIRIFDTMIYLGDDWYNENLARPASSPVTLLLDVDDTRTLHDKLVSMGAVSQHAPKDMFWGGTWAQVQDPFGVVWGLNAQTHEPTQQDMNEGFQEWYAQFT